MPRIVLYAKGRGASEVEIFYGAGRSHKTKEAAEASIRDLKEEMEQQGFTVEKILHYATDKKAEKPTVMTFE